MLESPVGQPIEVEQRTRSLVQAKQSLERDHIWPCCQGFNKAQSEAKDDN